MFYYGVCYDIIYNGSVYIAIGYDDYFLSKSSDGINWSQITSIISKSPGTSNLQNPTCIYFDGQRYIIGLQKTNGGDGVQYNSFITSFDGITWDESIRRVIINCVITAIAYNGTIYVISGRFRGRGTETILYFWSDDLITFNPINNEYMGTRVFDVIYNGKYFVVGGESRAYSTVGANINAIIYSVDGKIWFGSSNPEYDSCNGITVNPMV